MVAPPYTVAVTSPSVCTISGVSSESQTFSGRTASVTLEPSATSESGPQRSGTEPGSVSTPEE